MLVNLLAIYKRELRNYFVLPWAYVIAAVFWFINGFLFFSIVFGDDGVIRNAQFNDLQASSGIVAGQYDAAYQVVTVFLATVGSLALFILPILSMGLYSEERKRGTLELLATSPITNWVVAVGKLLAVVTFFIGLTLPLMVYIVVALSAATPPVSTQLIFVGYGALILMAASVLSLGMFISSLTDSTIVAAIATFGLVLLLSLIDLIAKSPTMIGQAINQIALIKQYQEMIQGQVTSSGLVMFASYIVLGVFLTAQSIEAFRFQRS
ncbi:ABC transporter permease [Romeriopsis navalis]|nr:ABC transporter permease [Romeriopsis navalis]